MPGVLLPHRGLLKEEYGQWWWNFIMTINDGILATALGVHVASGSY